MQKIGRTSTSNILEDLEKTLQYFEDKKKRLQEQDFYILYEKKKVIDNINPFKHLISLGNELSAIRLQEGLFTSM